MICCKAERPKWQNDQIARGGLNSKTAGAGFDYIIGEVDEELRQATLSGGVVAQNRREGGVAKGLRQALAEGLAGTSIVAKSVLVVSTEAYQSSRQAANIPQEAPNNMFEEPSRLLLYQLSNHVAEDGTHSIEALISGTDIVKTVVIKQDLLDDEDGNRLAELRPGLHDPQAEGNDLGRKEKVDDLGGIVLDKRTDDSQRSKPEVFKRTRLRRRVKERVEEEWDVR